MAIWPFGQVYIFVTWPVVYGVYLVTVAYFHMSSHGLCKKAGVSDLRKAFIRDERAVDQVFKELSFESQGFRQGQPSSQAVAQATSEEAVHSQRRVKEKVGHYA